MNDDDKNAFVQWGVAAASIVRRGKIIITMIIVRRPCLVVWYDSRYLTLRF